MRSQASSQEVGRRDTTQVLNVHSIVVNESDEFFPLARPDHKALMDEIVRAELNCCN